MLFIVKLKRVTSRVTIIKRLMKGIGKVMFEVAMYPNMKWSLERNNMQGSVEPSFYAVKYTLVSEKMQLNL